LGAKARKNGESTAGMGLGAFAGMPDNHMNSSSGSNHHQQQPPQHSMAAAVGLLVPEVNLTFSASASAPSQTPPRHDSPKRIRTADVEVIDLDDESPPKRIHL